MALEGQAYELAGQPFNLASPKQLADILFEKLGLPVKKKTPSGGPSTDEEVLSELALDYPLPNLADRFGVFELLPWRNDHELRQLMASFSGLLPLRRASLLDAPEVRQRVIALTQGVTGRIFRLIEAIAIAAIRSGREMIDAASFDDEKLLLPLVSMQVIANTNR